MMLRTLERLLRRPHSCAMHLRKVSRRRLRRAASHLQQLIVDLFLKDFDPRGLLVPNADLLLFFPKFSMVERVGVGVAALPYRLQLDRVVLGLRLRFEVRGQKQLVVGQMLGLLERGAVPIGRPIGLDVHV